ncbi:hypothetical protein DFH09DRAFT_1453530 [Mycena vulgaris]|nr:hypothetical protein DFH09DRAFT_1453530 [Mycena vulgaris]
MSSLARQRTLESVRSWWSDSNPTGPNINLHALAKPLMKFMYHRQALDYIAEHDGKPLSSDDMEIYASYLESGPGLFPCPLADGSYRFKHISSVTKTAVLRELTARVKSQGDADTMTNFLLLYPLDLLLESRNADIQGWTCRLLEALESRRRNRTGTWTASVCKQLVSLLHDKNGIVRAESVSALLWITKNSDGAQAVAAPFLDRVAGLLKSPITAIRAQSCELLVALASHKATAPGVLGANICEQLVTLLRKSPEGVQAAIDANLLDHVAELLESRAWYTRNLMCSMLAAHDGMLAILVGGMHCKQLASFLYLEHNGYAAEALHWISESPEGAQAVVVAGVLKSVNSLLDLSGYVQREACKMLGALASHGSSITAVLGATPLTFGSETLQSPLSPKSASILRASQRLQAQTSKPRSRSAIANMRHSAKPVSEEEEEVNYTDTLELLKDTCPILNIEHMFCQEGGGKFKEIDDVPSLARTRAAGCSVKTLYGTRDTPKVRQTRPMCDTPATSATLYRQVQHLFSNATHRRQLPTTWIIEFRPELHIFREWTH